jgi:hypothetical protein
MFLNTIIVRLEGFLEFLVVLDNSPVSTFGNLDGTAADPIATLLQIQAELPSIKRDIESSADSWRH